MIVRSPKIFTLSPPSILLNPQIFTYSAWFASCLKTYLRNPYRYFFEVLYPLTNYTISSQKLLFFSHPRKKIIVFFFFLQKFSFKISATMYTLKSAQKVIRKRSQGVSATHVGAFERKVYFE